MTRKVSRGSSIVSKLQCGCGSTPQMTRGGRWLHGQVVHASMWLWLNATDDSFSTLVSPSICALLQCGCGSTPQMTHKEFMQAAVLAGASMWLWLNATDDLVSFENMVPLIDASMWLWLNATDDGRARVRHWPRDDSFNVAVAQRHR